MTTTPTILNVPPLCRHLRMGGRPCRAIALKGHAFCYAHSMTHLERRASKRLTPSRRPLAPELLIRLSNLNDFQAIHQVLCALLAAAAQSRISNRNASQATRALDIASRNTVGLPTDATTRQAALQEAADLIVQLQSRPPKRPPQVQ